MLSLPALLVCIGILIPFITAVIYSFQRYRLSQPWARQFNWGDNYLNFFTDPAFWNTLKVSLLYAGITVALELLLGLGIALLLQKPLAVNNFISIMLLLPLMTAPALAALMWKLMTNPEFRHPQLFRKPDRTSRFPLGIAPRRRCSPSFSSISGSTRPSS